jgi:hypothetical protein
MKTTGDLLSNDFQANGGIYSRYHKGMSTSVPIVKLPLGNLLLLNVLI